MSQYFTPFRIDEESTSTNTSKFQNLVIPGGTVTTSTAIYSRRICISNGVYPSFVAFGNDPSVSTSTGFTVPAHSYMVFNFKSGDKVAAISPLNNVLSILDLD